MSTAPQNRGGLGRLLNVVAAIAIGGAIVGFVVGTRPMPRPDTPGMPLPTASIPKAAAARPGVTASIPYRKVRERRAAGEEPRTSDLERLRATIPKLTDPVVQTEEDKAAALALRASRRAYDGAPPTIPHGIDEQGVGSCLGCHARGIEVQGVIAPVLSHTAYVSCTQCHVPATGGMGLSSPPTDGSFQGVASPVAGERAGPGAPPTIPHTLQMRDHCASCHGVTGRKGLRTTHPTRRQCRQCHAATLTGAPWSLP